MTEQLKLLYSLFLKTVTTEKWGNQKRKTECEVMFIGYVYYLRSFPASI